MRLDIIYVLPIESWMVWYPRYGLRQLGSMPSGY